MLHTVFSFRGNDFKSNRIPESYEQLLDAANAMMEKHEPGIKGHIDFNITFITQNN